MANHFLPNFQVLLFGEILNMLVGINFNRIAVRMIEKREGKDTSKENWHQRLTT